MPYYIKSMECAIIFPAPILDNFVLAFKGIIHVLVRDKLCLIQHIQAKLPTEATAVETFFVHTGIEE